MLLTTIVSKVLPVSSDIDQDLDQISEMFLDMCDDDTCGNGLCQHLRSAMAALDAFENNVEIAKVWVVTAAAANRK